MSWGFLSLVTIHQDMQSTRLDIMLPSRVDCMLVIPRVRCPRSR